MKKTIAIVIAGLFATAAFAQTPASKTAVLVPNSAVAKAKVSDTTTAAKADVKEAKADAKDSTSAAKADVKVAKAATKKTKHTKTAHKAGVKTEPNTGSEATTGADTAATPATPATPETAATLDTPAAPATPATPATPASPAK